MYGFMKSSHSLRITMFCLSVMTLSCCGGPAILMSYGAPDPISECRESLTDLEYQPCTETKACSLVGENLGRIRFESDNWTKKYHMYCDQNVFRETARSLLVLSSLISSNFGLLASDYFGRRPGYLVTAVVVLIGCVGIFLGDSFFLKMIGTGVVNSALVTYSSLYAITLSEWIRNLVLTSSFIEAPSVHCGSHVLFFPVWKHLLQFGDLEVH